MRYGGIRIKCYIKNEVVYDIRLRMTIEELQKQIDNKLVYLNEEGHTEIIYLDKFDKVVVNDDIRKNWEE
jgi:hypothetical protein